MKMASRDYSRQRPIKRDSSRRRGRSTSRSSGSSRASLRDRRSTRYSRSPSTEEGRRYWQWESSRSLSKDRQKRACSRKHKRREVSSTSSSESSWSSSESSDSDDSGDGPERARITGRKLVKILHRLNLEYDGVDRQKAIFFLDRLKYCRQIGRIDDQELFDVIAVTLQGVASIWLDTKRSSFKHWQHFEKSFRDMFIGGDCGIMYEMRKRKQGENETILQFLTHIRYYIVHLSKKPSIDQLIEMVWGNLRPEYRRACRDRMPDSLEKIEREGEIYEETLKNDSDTVLPLPGKAKRKPPIRSSQKAEAGAVPRDSNRRRFWGACHDCSEIGHRARDCTKRRCYRCRAIGHIARDCPSAPPGKPNPQKTNQPEAPLIIERAWAVIACEILELPSCSSSESKWLVVFIDLFSRRVELKVIPYVTILDFAIALNELVIDRWDKPDFYIICDTEKEHANWMNAVFEIKGIQQVKIPSDCAAPNPIELLNRTMKTMIDAYVAAHHVDSWDRHLNELRRAINSSVQL
ncbi:uncharacterized protein LOC106652409 isoform X1 [Trichogramma pretiosum]|uniref:uncharacterized protein LOC106652409 isoform X1 n=1 Tax=Trichogramma pretiosum TaxID=7493 RepID=UPI000C7194D8|nr:uncharacterized protein LOC106652409 isoform X1 [Trichogramma pretiosum]